MNNLINQVRLINPEAADWLDANRGKLNRDPTTLASLMTWDATPQGHDYWDDIRKQLQDNSPEANVRRGAAWLDREHPGWTKRAKGADTSTHTDNVLCRVTAESYYVLACETVGLSDPQDSFLGFSQTNSLYQRLWSEAIAERLAGKQPQPAEPKHPFTIHDNGSVSYYGHTLNKSQIEVLIKSYGRKSNQLNCIVNDWHPKLIASHLQISCQRFTIEQIEAFIKEYESRPAEQTIRMGQRVRINNDEYIVARCGAGEYILTCLSNGNRWNAPISTKEVDIPLSAFFVNGSPITDYTVEVL